MISQTVQEWSRRQAVRVVETDALRDKLCSVDAVSRPLVFFWVLTRYQRVTDRLTDRQTRRPPMPVSRCSIAERDNKPWRPSFAVGGVRVVIIIDVMNINIVLYPDPTVLIIVRHLGPRYWPWRRERDRWDCVLTVTVLF